LLSVAQPATVSSAAAVRPDSRILDSVFTGCS
jgi:hypothetical protein